jgi:pimeloyl-ACP methyl ester carboxylesterase
VSGVSSHVRVEVADGTNLFVRTDGRQRGATPLVCLPGLTRNGRDFTAIAERHAPSRFVVRLDFRGRGRSSYAADPGTYAPQVYAADTVAVLDALGIERAVLLGTSLGGSVSMHVATVAPDRVAGVILNDVGPKLEPEGFARIQSCAGKLPTNATWAEATEQLQGLYGPLAAVIGAAAFDRMVREQYHEFGPGDIRPDHDPRIVAGMGAVDPHAIPPTWPLFDALAGVPALVLRGAVSDLFAASTVTEMQARKPDLLAVTVPDRGHCPLLDEPESVTAIDRFLAAVDA